MISMVEQLKVCNFFLEEIKSMYYQLGLGDLLIKFMREYQF